MKANQYGFDESEDDMELSGRMLEWQKTLQLNSPRIAQENEELTKFIRVKHGDNFDVFRSSIKKKEMKLVDILGDLSKQEDDNKKGCCHKAKINIISESSSDADVDDLDLRLNTFMAGQKKAFENWKKMKFRLMIISKFSTLEAFSR